MTSNRSADVGIEFLSWVNAELRKHAELEDDQDDDEGQVKGFFNRVRTFLSAGITTGAMLLTQFLLFE